MAEKLLDRLRQGGLTLLIERDGRLAFASDRPGLRPLFRGSIEHPEIFEGAEVALASVGLAAAHVLVHAKVARVVSPLVSREAEKLLDEAGIEHEAEQRVKQLKATDDEDELEQLARDAETPARLLDELRKRLA